MLLIALLVFIAGLSGAFFMPLLAMVVFGGAAVALLGIGAAMGLLPGQSAVPLMIVGAITLQLGYAAGIGARTLLWRRHPRLAGRETDQPLASAHRAGAHDAAEQPASGRLHAPDGTADPQAAASAAKGGSTPRQTRMALDEDMSASRGLLKAPFAGSGQGDAGLGRHGVGQQARHAVPKDGL